MEDAILFMSTKTATPESDKQARVLSVALHTIMSCLLLGEESQAEPDATEQRQREITDHRMRSLAGKVMKLYPDRWDMLEELMEVGEQAGLHLTLLGAIQ